MSHPDKPRRRTPRVPANVLYERILPIFFVLMAAVLLIVIVIALIGLAGAVR